MKKILQISDSPFPMCYSNDAVMNSILTNSALLDENVAIISDIKYNGQKIDMEDKSFKGIVQKNLGDNYYFYADKFSDKINDEIVVFRKKARVMLVIEMCLAVAAYFIDFVSIACSALLALITTGVLMSAELLNKRRR